MGTLCIEKNIQYTNETINEWIEISQDKTNINKSLSFSLLILLLTRLGYTYEAEALTYTCKHGQKCSQDEKLLFNLHYGIYQRTRLMYACKERKEARIKYLLEQNYL